ncbi:MAG: SBBP repeat-containing protein [Chlamydiota bacterium]
MTRVDEAAGRIRGEFNAHPMLIGAMVVCGCLLGAVARAAERGPDSAGTMDAVARLATAGVSALSTDSFVGDSAYRWHTFYGAITADRAYGVAVDGAGNVYITGRSRSTWNGPTGQPPLHDHSDSGTAPDIVVLKLNSSGAYQWHTFYGTSGTDNSADYGYAVAIDGSTDVYVTGFSYGSWNGPAGQPPKHAYSGSQDQSSNAFVLKLDQWGAYQWHTFYGSGAYAGDSGDEGRGIALDAGAGVYVAMCSRDTWNGPGGELPQNAYVGAGEYDIAVLALEKDGSYRWHTFYGSGDTDECFSIALDTGAGVYVTGYSVAAWNGPTGQSPRHAYAGGWDITALKLDSAGAYQWHTFYGGVSENDEGRGVAVNGSNRVYITGRSHGSWQGDGGVNPIHPYAGEDDAVVLRLDAAGAYQWHTFYGSATANDYGLDVAFDSGANVYAAGRSLADWSGDAGALPLHQYSGGVDIMALKLDDAGAYQWHTFYGSAADDYGQDIAIDSRDKIHVAGYSKASWLGDADAPPLHAYTGGDDIVDLALFLPAPTPTPTPTPAPTPIPLNLIVNKPAFNATDRITITADLTVGGTPYAGRPCYPYVRFLTPDSRYYYLTGSGALVPDRKTPYATGRDGGPMMFFADVQGYPVFSAGFSNVATGTYRLQGALVDAGCNIMGTMADRVLSVGSVTPTPAPPTPSPTATTAPTPTAAPSPI